MYPAKFDYYAATSLPEALQLLGQHQDAKIIAGGHSLLPLMKLRLAQPPALIDIGRVQELRGIKREGNMISIGALTTHAQIEASSLLREQCPILPEAAALIGDLQVRNRGTVGGSLSHADPAADLPAVMLALGAEIIATGPKGPRTIPADHFFTGLFTTALNSDEVLTAVRVWPVGKGGAYVKHPHPASRYAVVGVAVTGVLEAGKVKYGNVAITGVSDHAYKATGVEQALIGQPLNAEAIAAAAKHATDGVTVLSDLTASDKFRAHLAEVYTIRALEKLGQRLNA